MKRFLLMLVVVTIVGLAGGVSYMMNSYPNVSKAPEVDIVQDEVLVERGRYLAHHVAVCMDCHSTRDWSRYSGPLIKGTEGRGGQHFGPEVGLPGDFYAKNITPAALADWTNGEILWAITAGVSRDGSALFPIMPYPDYAHFTMSDALAIVAYLRQLPPLNVDIPPPEIDFPMSVILRTIPKDPTFTPEDELKDPVKRGEYLTRVAGCMECHTQMDKGKRMESQLLAGGREFAAPFGILRSANITFDKESGIGSWSEDTFVQRFKGYGDELPHVEAGEKNTIMPWAMYAGMKEDDLRSIYQYLKTVEPKRNKVRVFEAETKL